MSILRKLKEQGVEKFKGGTADLQDLSGPNKPVGSSEREQHHGLTEDEIEEGRSTTTSIGGTHRPKTTFPNSNKAGGGLVQRSSAQRSGNQGRTVATYTEEATRIVKKKISEKKGEQPLGKTLTNQPGDSIDTSPEKPELR
jgi:hypothetical protein